MEETENKRHLEYPCAWIYKIIGTDEDEMRMAVNEIIQDRTCLVTFSRSSRNNSYRCLNVEVIVESESHRQTLYELLKAHRAIKIIL